MSRNKEKAQSVLNRYYAQQGPAVDRPRRTENVSSAHDAETYRKMCLNEIGRDMMRINDLLLNEYQIRDINDRLNKLMREKRAWEYRIKELGGPDLMGLSKADDAGAVIVNGYRYYGRAKELGDAKEAQKMRVEADQVHKKQKSKGEVKRQIQEHEFSPEYYGFGNPGLESYERRRSRELAKPTTATTLPQVSDTVIEKYILDKLRAQLAAKLDN